MTIFDFTVEEINLIAMYRTETLAATLGQLTAAFPDMEGEIGEIGESAYRKLAELDETAFAGMFFVPADETEGEK